MFMFMLQVRYGALLSKADPHCAVALLGEVPPWGVMLRLGDHACCQLLCNVQAELGRDLGISLLPPHQGRPRERGKGAVLPSGTYTPSPSGCLGAGRARRRKPHKSPQWLGPAFSADSMELPQLLAAPIQCSSTHPLRATAPPLAILSSSVPSRPLLLIVNPHSAPARLHSLRDFARRVAVFLLPARVREHQRRRGGASPKSGSTTLNGRRGPGELSTNDVDAVCIGICNSDHV